MSGLC